MIGDPDYYEVLEVSPHASQEVIEAAYRRLARKYHPDHGGDESKMKLLNRAYETLRDPIRRAEYDLKRAHATGESVKTDYRNNADDSRETWTASGGLVHAVSPLRVAVLSLFPLYLFVWFYQTMKSIKTFVERNYNPLWRTLGLLVPILGLVISYETLADIGAMRKQSGLSGWFRPGWLLFALATGIGLSRQDDLWLLGTLVVSFTMYYIQRRLNEVWFILDGHKRTRPWNSAEIAILIIGIFLWTIVFYDSLIYSG